MKCEQCKNSVNSEEHNRVKESFDFDYVLCFPCAEEVWKELEEYDGDEHLYGDEMWEDEYDRT